MALTSECPGLRVLIAGCGYVGQELARQWLGPSTDKGLVPASALFALRRRPAARLDGMTTVQADLAAGDLRALPHGLDLVIYAAAPDDSSAQAYEAVYVRGVARLKEHLTRTGAGGASLVLTSSTSVYGQHQGEVVNEEAETKPASPTAAIILRGEALLESGDAAVRLGGIYGPDRLSFVRSVRDGTLVVNPTASALTNRIHRDDAAAILRFVGGLAHARRHQRVYNGVDCDGGTRAEVAAWLAERLGVTLQTSSETEASTFLRGHKRVSNERLLAAGYRFRFPSYREGYGALLGQV